jgi:hypothetical protein
MKHGIEKLRGLWYKLRMMGIPLTGPSYIYGDNKSQVTIRPDQNRPWKRNVTLSATMQFKSQWRWENPWSLISALNTINLT